MLKFLNKLFGIPEPKPVQNPPITITIDTNTAEVKPETIVANVPEVKEPEVKVTVKQKPARKPAKPATKAKPRAKK